MTIRNETEWPRDDWTLAEYRDWLKIWIDKSRQELGEEFNIEGALRLADSRALMHVTHILRSEYRAELKKVYAKDPNRCIYCGNNLDECPGLGRYCDICADKFMDRPVPREDEDFNEEGE